jgi:hypothetical protein
MKKNYNLKLVGALTAMLSFASVEADAQYITFQQVYPSTFDQSARDILETSDGGYIILGMSENTTPGDTNIYVMKTDVNGVIQWTGTYGGNNPDYGYSIVEAGGGNYLIAGYTKSYGAGDYDSWLVKINSTGGEIWNKTYGGTGNDQAKSIVATDDGNYMLCGRTNSNNANSATNFDAYLMKVDASGTEIWTKYYGAGVYEAARQLTKTLDGGYAFVGLTNTFGMGMGDVYVVRTNGTGDTLWTKCYGGINVDDGNEILATADGGFVIATETKSFGAGDFDVELFKIDGNGAVQWNELYGGTEKDVIHMLEQTNDGGFILGCISRSFGWIEPDMWLIKTNSSGAMTWSHNYGSFDHEHLYSAKQTADGGYALIGHSKSYGPNMKAMFIKVNDAGTFATSVNDLSSTELFNIYPNPSEGEVKINWASISDSRLTVTNALGQVILSEQISETNSKGTTVIDLKNEIPGMYFFNLTSAEKTSTAKVLIR